MERFYLKSILLVCSWSSWLYLGAVNLTSAQAQPEGLPNLLAPPQPAPNLPAVPGSVVQADSLPTVSLFTDTSYILGPGDRLSLIFFNVPEYDGEKQIAVDGALTLPLLGKVPVSGMTIDAATQAISMAYAPYLKTPLVTVDLVSPRPIQIGISGEVNQPGAYEIPLAEGDSEAALAWPTLVEAIQLAGGITDRADIQGVEIRRAQSQRLSQGQSWGQSQLISLNLWDILTTGSINNDITLRHGDAINIPTATALTPNELTQLSAANFSPDAIQVTVVGEVPEPGAIEIEPNAPLNQALLAAGGFDPRRADVDSVELVRLNPDGTVSQRTIPVAFDQGINEESNPALRNNDVVLVGRSGRAAFADTTSTVFGPLGAILSPFRLLIDLFN